PRAKIAPSIAGRFDPGPLDHKDHGALRRAGPMHHALRDGHGLARRELDPPTLQLDDEPSLHHVEELVLPVVLVPVKLSLHHAEPHDTGRSHGTVSGYTRGPWTPRRAPERR